MKLTKKEAIKRHRELWGWLAENPMKEKTDWPRWERYDAPLNGCFLCEYALKSKKNDSNRLNICDYCPVEFKETNDYPRGTFGYCLGGLFIRWLWATNPKERSRLASLIRDLPEKKEQSARKFKVGDKVVPVRKSIRHIMQENGCEYLIVTRINATFGNSNIVEAENPFSSGYWYFIESDLIPYVKPKPKNLAPENKTLQDDPRLQRVLQQIAEEVERATSKFALFNSSHEGFAVLMEEVDELWDEVKSNRDPANMRTEAIQVGAMAVRFLLDVCKEG